VAQVRLFKILVKSKAPPSSYEALFNVIEKLHVLQQIPILSLYKDVINIKPIEKQYLKEEAEKAKKAKVEEKRKMNEEIAILRE